MNNISIDTRNFITFWFPLYSQRLKLHSVTRWENAFWNQLIISIYFNFINSKINYYYYELSTAILSCEEFTYNISPLKFHCHFTSITELQAHHTTMSLRWKILCQNIEHSKYSIYSIQSKNLQSKLHFQFNFSDLIIFALKIYRLFPNEYWDGISKMVSTTKYVCNLSI